MSKYKMSKLIPTTDILKLDDRNKVIVNSNTSCIGCTNDELIGKYKIYKKTLLDMIFI